MGGFSSAPNTRRPAELLADPAALRKLRLLYVACGDQDGLLRISQGVHAMLDEKKVPHVYRVIPGGKHDFAVWKSDLYHFARLVFRDPGPPRPAVPAATPAPPADDATPASTNIGTAAYPRVHPDNRVTFRLRAPTANKVQVFTNYGLGNGGPWDMTKGDDGFWSLTTPPVVPSFHYYGFVSDEASRH